MDNGVLFEMLLERVRQEMAPVQERIAERRAEDALLSDEEWFEKRLAGVRANNPQHAKSAEKLLKATVQSRHLIGTEDSPEVRETVYRMRAERLFPHLLAIRGEGQGPITDEEYRAAQMRESQASIKEMGVRLREAAAKSDGSPRGLMIRALAKMAQLNEPLIASLAEPGVDEERLAKVTEKIRRRTERFTKRFSDGSSSS